MNSLLTINTSTGEVLEGQSAWTPPPLTYGGSLTIGMRFTRDVDGSTVGYSLAANSLKAAIGNIDARPVEGTWKLQIGEGTQNDANTTTELPVGVGPRELQGRINALASVVETYGECRVWTKNGSFIFQFGAGEVDVPMQVRSNRLHPISFGVVKSWITDAQWFQELRLTQAPVAMTDSSERVLPPPPTITRVQAGQTDGDEVYWNEIQALYIPPDFLGAYQLRRNFRRTGLLSRSDGLKQLEEALGVFGDTLKVTIPLNNTAHIEFAGDFKGQPQELLEVMVVTSPEGDLTFTLDLNSAELHAMLRVADQVTLPLSVKVMVAVEDEADRPMTLFTVPVTIRRSLFFPELALVPTRNWLFPPSPKDYVPRHPSQIITGQQHYPFVRGDGFSTTLIVPHDLDTEDIASVTLRENISGGRLLQLGVDYEEVRIINANSIEIDFAEAPEVNAIAGVITSAGPKSAFAEDLLIHIAQVIGLPETLENFGSRIVTLEEILPTTGAGAPAGSVASMTIDIPAKTKVMFWTGDVTKLETLPAKGAFMLPAVHTEDAETALPDPQPDPDTVDTPTVYTNTAETAIKLKTFGKVRDKAQPPIILPGGYAACDGRAWYPVERDGETNSFYPTLYNERLFYFFVSEKMLRVNRTMELEFGVLLQAINADSAASWVLDLRAGTAPQDAEPDPTGLNLQDILWADSPILRSRLIVGPLATAHYFGIRAKRSAGGIALDVSEYGVWEGRNDAAPSSANFLIEGRLTQFDTQNSRPNARGHILYKFFGGSMSGGGQTSDAQVKIY